MASITGVHVATQTRGYTAPPSVSFTGAAARPATWLAPAEHGDRRIDAGLHDRRLHVALERSHHFAAPTTIARGGNQSLQNDVSVAQLSILGVTVDLTSAQIADALNALTKLGGGDVTLASAWAGYFGDPIMPSPTARQVVDSAMIVKLKGKSY